MFAALRDIAGGHGVRRGDHELRDATGNDLSSQFLRALTAEGFRPTTVAAVRITQEERVPAWLVEGGRARFGYVFWERFTAARGRKLWGSVHKNGKGDRDRTLGARSAVTLYANPVQRTRTDPDHPTSW